MIYVGLLSLIKDALGLFGYRSINVTLYGSTFIQPISSELEMTNGRRILV